MNRPTRSPRRRRSLPSIPAAPRTVMMAVAVAIAMRSPTARAFAPQRAPPPRRPPSSLSAKIRRGGKFNKQDDLAAKMAAARRLREGGGGRPVPEAEAAPTAAQIRERNDRRRFEDMLEGSAGGADGGDLGAGFYLTEGQEEANADALHRGVARVYEGDPAPTAPFADLVCAETAAPLGRGGMRRFVPWEGSRTGASGDYLVVVADPRPKSSELRTAMARMVGGLPADIVRRCVVVNVDSPAENRRFLKRSFGSSEECDLRILVDGDKGWMREYTALGEKRFSMTMFILRDGRVEKIAREVGADVLPTVVRNAIKSLI